MKKFEFYCLPEQLIEWARTTHGIPAGVVVTEREVVELLFCKLFPDCIEYYAHDYGCRSISSSDVGHSSLFEIGIHHKKRKVSGDGSENCLVVSRVEITDVKNGIESKMLELQKMGLFKGTELIEQKVNEINSEYDRRKSEKNQQTTILSIIAFSLLVIYLGMLFWR